MIIKVNQNIPNVEIYTLNGEEPEIKYITNLFAGKKVLLLGLPGAFTSVCSSKHLPGYLLNLNKFKSKGVDLLACIAVNDPFVMNAWGKENKVGNEILMLGDPFLAFTKNIGAEVDKSNRGLGMRSSRYTMLIDDNKIINIQEEKETSTCEISSAENFLKLI